MLLALYLTLYATVSTGPRVQTFKLTMIKIIEILSLNTRDFHSSFHKHIIFIGFSFSYLESMFSVCNLVPVKKWFMLERPLSIFRSLDEAYNYLIKWMSVSYQILCLE